MWFGVVRIHYVDKIVFCKLREERQEVALAAVSVNIVLCKKRIADLLFAVLG
jgi:phosphoribosyl-ATP pyrophosphohydrolase